MGRCASGVGAQDTRPVCLGNEYEWGRRLPKPSSADERFRYSGNSEKDAPRAPRSRRSATRNNLLGPLWGPEWARGRRGANRGGPKAHFCFPRRVLCVSASHLQRPTAMRRNLRVRGAERPFLGARLRAPLRMLILKLLFGGRVLRFEFSDSRGWILLVPLCPGLVSILGFVQRRPR